MWTEGRKLLLYLKNLVYTVIVPATVAVYLPLSFVQGPTAASPGLFIIAVLGLVAGFLLIVRSVRDFAVFGQGTPAPMDPPKTLVVRGVYRYTRNPIYIGVLAVILGWVVLYQSATLLRYAFGTYLFFQGFIVLYEERHLRKVFGGAYEQYCAHVNRWLPTLDVEFIRRMRR